MRTSKSNLDVEKYAFVAKFGLSLGKYGRVHLAAISSSSFIIYETRYDYLDNSLLEFYDFEYVYPEI